MKVGDMIRVKNGTGYFEEGEGTSCCWPDAAWQIGVVMKMTTRSMSYQQPQYTVQIIVLGELAEFKRHAVEKI